jgi:hypothetical protein
VQNLQGRKMMTKTTRLTRQAELGPGLERKREFVFKRKVPLQPFCHKPIIQTQLQKVSAETDFYDDPFDEDYQESCPRDTFGDHFANDEHRASTKADETTGKSSYGDHIIVIDERSADDDITDIFMEILDAHSRNNGHQSTTDYINNDQPLIEFFNGDHITVIGNHVSTNTNNNERRL